MRAELVGLVILASCYDPAAPAGAPCSDDLSCPGGQTCVAQVCQIGAAPPPDAGPDAPGDLDLDDDGVPNTQDNCPTTSNFGQADEDGDSDGDACDPCPTVAKQASDLDVDGDQLLDVPGCDPDPAGASAIWQFFPFNVAPNTTKQTPGWTVSAGGYASDVAQAPRQFSFVNADFNATGLDFTDFTASTALAIRPSASAAYSAGLILIDWTIADETGDVYCELFEAQGARNLRIRTPGVRSTEAAKRLSWLDAADYRLSLRYVGGRYLCSAITPDGTFHTVEAESTNRPQTGDAAVMYAENADAVFRWLFVAGRRP